MHIQPQLSNDQGRNRDIDRFTSKTMVQKLQRAFMGAIYLCRTTNALGMKHKINFTEVALQLDIIIV